MLLDTNQSPAMIVTTAAVFVVDSPLRRSMMERMGARYFFIVRTKQSSRSDPWGFFVQARASGFAFQAR